MCCGGGGRRRRRASAGAGHLPRHRAWPRPCSGRGDGRCAAPAWGRAAPDGRSVGGRGGRVGVPTAGHELDDDGRRLAESLHAETEGNPFFVGEVLRHLVETGMVRRQADRWVVARGGTTAVPEGVRDVVGRRARDGCQRRPARCCRWRPCSAATSTSSCWPRCEMPRRAACLTPWTRRWGRTCPGDGRGPLPLCPRIGPRRSCWRSFPRRRRRLHWRVGEATEKLRLDDVIVALAYHFSQAGPDGEGTSRAVRYGLAAAEQALQARARATRRRAFTRSWDCWTTATDAAPARIAALCGLGEAQRDQGNAEFRTTSSRRAGWPRLPPTLRRWSGPRWPTRVDCRA